MKFLIDMNLSTPLVSFLVDKGFDAVHWSTVGQPKTGRWPPAKHPTLATSSRWKEDACHPKGELRSSWKSNRLGHLADELAFNCRFSGQPWAPDSEI